MASVKGIDHIGVVVADIDEAAKLYKELLGVELVHVDTHPEHGVKVGFLDCGNTEIELLQPLSPDSGIGKYLEKRGPGMHHVCFETDDIHREWGRLKEQCIQLIDQEPRHGAVGEVGFLHPKAGNGVLIEFNQVTFDLPWRKHQ
jgi:methylmalonyl-CoA/ethylmalonyl-CoA epimerase